ncbi:MAG: prepilin-type N-terminal cleavage/methylation domain-containing protein [Myxococcales bacterium]|nr:prepilin-type N-terminal cleavage/methylation domain-containing protein [Myxococcales bacterium]
MIVVAIIGVLASVAIPTFNNFVMRSKSSEAFSNIGAIYKLTAAYYESPRAMQGVTGPGGEHCIVQSDSQDDEIVPNFAFGPPTAQKRTVDFSTSPRFVAIGFTSDDPLYYTYVHATGSTGPGTCNAPPGPYHVYQLAAIGDLDGDGRPSGQSMFVGIDAQGNMFHGPGFFEQEVGNMALGMPFESE